MIGVANKLSDADIDAAINIWLAAYQMIGDQAEEKSAGIITNMWVFARRYLSKRVPNHKKRVVPAIKILHAIYSVYEDSESRESVISYIMNKAAKFGIVRRKGINFLGRTNRHNLDPDFHVRLVGGFLYYSRDYEGVIFFIDAINNPIAPVTALKAEALRKQHKPDAAIKIANKLLKRFSGRAELDGSRARALVDALCCRGYCRTEKGQLSGRQSTLNRAVTDFKQAISKAETFRLPIPPRAYTGLSRAYEQLGKPQKALAAAQKALELDRDSEKALNDIARLTPPPA